MTQAYPLQWPRCRERRPSRDRKIGRFTVGKTIAIGGSEQTYRRQQEITVSQAVERLLAELNRIGAIGAIISTNLEVRNDGFPRSGQRQPDDPAICVYFTLAGTRGNAGFLRRSSDQRWLVRHLLSPAPITFSRDFRRLRT